jgi:peptidyl-Lys metalloendopeptidase
MLVLLLGASTGAMVAAEPPCKGSELAAAEAARVEADAALSKAISAIGGPSKEEADRLQTWLGVRSSAESESVRSVYVRAQAFMDALVFLCSVKTDLKIGDVYAYVNPQEAFVITLGPYFFSAPNRGFNSKLGVIVHEMTHFVLAGATKDRGGYGVSAAKKLAASNPRAAQASAENLEYFVEAVVFGL